MVDVHHQRKIKNATAEAIIYPLLVVIIMWSVFILDRYYQLNLYRFGVEPQTINGLKGILLMPFIHGQRDFGHIINNSIPTFVLLAALIYFYREIALYVVLFVWFGGGFLLWYFAENTGSFHIGMSGVIYGLFGFLLFSGFLRKYLPLQAIALFVAFVYGSLIWGVFPMKPGVSWEGHLAGILVGLVVAFAFRKRGPLPPKYRYEIEQEMGIEPPDFEKEWLERNRAYQEAKNKTTDEYNQSNKHYAADHSKENKGLQITYEFKPKKKDSKD
jgi:membrane associated rhomboid family serine protease